MLTSFSYLSRVAEGSFEPSQEDEAFPLPGAVDVHFYSQALTSMPERASPVESHLSPVLCLNVYTVNVAGVK